MAYKNQKKNKKYVKALHASEKKYSKMRVKETQRNEIESIIASGDISQFEKVMNKLGLR
jgi:hypothetical protein